MKVRSAVLLQTQRVLKSPGGRDKTQIGGLISRISDSAGPGWGERTCISNKSPGAAAAPSLRTSTFEN